MTVKKKEYDPKRLIRGLAGFISYGLSNNLTAEKILVEISHDLGGYIKNSKEDWFFPRTEGFSKYLTLL